jgi:hypothetical protein
MKLVSGDCAFIKKEFESILKKDCKLIHQKVGTGADSSEVRIYRMHILGDTIQYRFFYNNFRNVANIEVSFRDLAKMEQHNICLNTDSLNTKDLLKAVA